MIDGKLISGMNKSTVSAPGKQDIALSEQNDESDCPITLGDPVEAKSEESEELDLSLGDLSPDVQSDVQSSATDDGNVENKEALPNNDDPQPNRKVTGKKRRMGRRRLPSGAE